MLTEPQPVAAVESGMKMLSWQYCRRDPRVLVERLVKVGRPGGWDTLGPVLGSFAALGLGGVAVAVTDAPVWIGMLVYVPAILLLGYGRATARWLRQSRDEQPPVDSPQVVFTSTGVLFGPFARLWSGPDERLVRVSNRHRRKRMFLDLDFQGAASRWTRMTIPVPRELEVAAIEVLQTLKAKIEGTTAAAEHHARMVARAVESETKRPK